MAQEQRLSAPGLLEAVKRPAALIKDTEGDFIGIDDKLIYIFIYYHWLTMLSGHRIGQIRLIFSFGPQTLRLLFGNHKPPSKYLAYVEWFKSLGKKPQPNHLLFCIQHSLTKDGSRLASIISIESIQHSVHLFPQFGSVAS